MTAACTRGPSSYYHAVLGCHTEHQRSRETVSDCIGCIQRDAKQGITETEPPSRHGPPDSFLTTTTAFPRLLGISAASVISQLPAT